MRFSYTYHALSTAIYFIIVVGNGALNTKSISRFARNTVDVQNIVRKLKTMNVPVVLENEQLYSFDKEAKLAISLHRAIA